MNERTEKTKRTDEKTEENRWEQKRERERKRKRKRASRESEQREKHRIKEKRDNKDPEEKRARHLLQILLQRLDGLEHERPRLVAPETAEHVRNATHLKNPVRSDQILPAEI